eukprot:1355815-Amorphochlora_amoeboformis.AAC.1
MAAFSEVLCGLAVIISAFGPGKCGFTLDQSRTSKPRVGRLRGGCSGSEFGPVHPTAARSRACALGHGREAPQLRVGRLRGGCSGSKFGWVHRIAKSNRTFYYLDSQNDVQGPFT